MWRTTPLRTVWDVAWRIGIGCAAGSALALPEWLPSEWTREDGPIEWAGFVCYLASGLLALLVAARLRRCGAGAAGVGLLVLFGLVLLAVAGEEISWGQRLLDLETPEALVDGNRQDELNLHNVDGLQDKVVLGQLALAAAGALLPSATRWPWARVGVPLFASYLAYRTTRAVAALLDWAPAGDHAEAAELLLGAGVLAVVIRLAGRPNALAVVPSHPVAGR